MIQALLALALLAASPTAGESVWYLSGSTEPVGPLVLGSDRQVAQTRELWPLAGGQVEFVVRHNWLELDAHSIVGSNERDVAPGSVRISSDDNRRSDIGETDPDDRRDLVSGGIGIRVGPEPEDILGPIGAVLIGLVATAVISVLVVLGFWTRRALRRTPQNQKAPWPPGSAVKPHAS